MIKMSILNINKLYECEYLFSLFNFRKNQNKILKLIGFKLLFTPFIILKFEITHTQQKKVIVTALLLVLTENILSTDKVIKMLFSACLVSILNAYFFYKRFSYSYVLRF